MLDRGGRSRSRFRGRTWRRALQAGIGRRFFELQPQDLGAVVPIEVEVAHEFREVVRKPGCSKKRRHSVRRSFNSSAAPNTSPAATVALATRQTAPIESDQQPERGRSDENRGAINGKLALRREKPSEENGRSRRLPEQRQRQLRIKPRAGIAKLFSTRNNVDAAMVRKSAKAGMKKPSRASADRTAAMTRGQRERPVGRRAQNENAENDIRQQAAEPDGPPRLDIDHQDVAPQVSAEKCERQSDQGHDRKNDREAAQSSIFPLQADHGQSQAGRHCEIVVDVPSREQGENTSLTNHVEPFRIERLEQTRERRDRDEANPRQLPPPRLRSAAGGLSRPPTDRGRRRRSGPLWDAAAAATSARPARIGLPVKARLNAASTKPSAKGRGVAKASS